MKELIKISSNENDEQVVSARELHKGLGLKKQFSDWWKQNSKLLIEHEDFEGVLVSVPYNPKYPDKTQQLDDYALTIDTAKHLAMQSQTEKGREYRKYFIQVEKAWNSPDMVMKRALQIADKRVIALQIENNHLNLELAEANKKLPFLEWALQTKGLVTPTIIAKKYGKTAIWLNNWLHKQRVQFKQGKCWVLYKEYAGKGYSDTIFSPTDIDHLHPSMKWTVKGMKFIYELLKENGYLPISEQDDLAS
ncbi:phage antirepressor KilAC domain-containing protein [Lactococcus cremoris]|uniref:AntA/AntB antirepressor n=1 Tax=Lactococcus cremoris subsp. cremoris TIFN6 TaxID=1234876 RepID=T0SIG0_LACLC|nr:phage antirepressor KilAC domain-containing protein [Lactococcus cremoris]EQC58096.1 AntA/AntB antirepressor [Lactococcus cremoris subsp. cremoris TIFN6]QGJ84646.1 antirepressor [Lactococcus phage proPhi6]UXV60066.1 phage antirepressor KilAC domain-containing protein [Lactococcus cremoris]